MNDGIFVVLLLLLLLVFLAIAGALEKRAFGSSDAHSLWTVDRVDMIERNHVFDGTRHQFSQFIFWEWLPGFSKAGQPVDKMHAVDWAMIKHDRSDYEYRLALSLGQSWPLGKLPPLEENRLQPPHRYSVQRHQEGWRVRFATTRGRYEVNAPAYRETWTQDDPEVADAQTYSRLARRLLAGNPFAREVR